MYRLFRGNFSGRSMIPSREGIGLYQRMPFGDTYMIIGMVLAALLIVLATVLIIKMVKTKKNDKGSLALDVLNRKLINGEVSDEEYVKLKKHILNS